jgi:hypothetical protein
MGNNSGKNSCDLAGFRFLGGLALNRRFRLTPSGLRLTATFITSTLLYTHRPAETCEFGVAYISLQ